jgi:CRP-like cAMP-binding protein
MASGSDGKRRGAAGRPHARSRRATAGESSTTDDGAARTANENDARHTGVPPWRGGNRVLAALPDDERSTIRSELTEVVLESGQILYEQRAPIDYVYFPDTAVLSLLNRMNNGAVVEVGTIGNEGGVDLRLFLGATVSVPETMAQIPGTAQRMTAAAFSRAITELPRFREIVGRCVHAFMTQVSQTAACNRLHGIEERCARWLLLTHDRVGGADSFPLTHQFLSFMLGVRRAGVTEALGTLGQSGLISSKNGQITILDRPGLEAAACECYAVVRRYAGEPFGRETSGDIPVR